MKVYLIKASAGSDYSKYKAETGGPPQNIFSTAAATPDGVVLDMCDETIGMKTNLQSDAELIAIFMSTPDAFRAYELAEVFKSQGKTIVLGGLHTKFNQAEAQQHGDTLLIGEPEGIWEQLLEDFNNGELKKKYERDSPVDLSELSPYPTDIIHPKQYDYTWSVVVGRGCPNKCEFCLVPRFFDSCRFRPIANIVDEVRRLQEMGVIWVELHADNLTANRKYALELFRALAPIKMNFYGETTILLAKDEELLQAAREAGVKALLFGIETPSKAALAAQGKQFVRPEKVRDYIATVKSYGIEVWGNFLYGFDEHTPEIFKESEVFVWKIKMDRVFHHLVIPFPGSRLYQKLDDQDRILTKDWSEYDGSHVVFRPKQMTPEMLEDGVYKLWLSSMGSIRSFLSWLTPKAWRW